MDSKVTKLFKYPEIKDEQMISNSSTLILGEKCHELPPLPPYIRILISLTILALVVLEGVQLSLSMKVTLKVILRLVLVDHSSPENSMEMETFKTHDEHVLHQQLENVEDDRQLIELETIQTHDKHVPHQHQHDVKDDKQAMPIEEHNTQFEQVQEEMEQEQPKEASEESTIAMPIQLTKLNEEATKANSQEGKKDPEDDLLDADDFGHGKRLRKLDKQVKSSYIINKKILVKLKTTIPTNNSNPMRPIPTDVTSTLKVYMKLESLGIVEFAYEKVGTVFPRLDSN
ncbi:hypothetical protein FNV43_RR05667 [Rhamnella rubrinervis]|uniref:Uncharacterized protein n=1 Tax=Rhamnella rubrinervis TaxID=2594499 RepID=A0A8K0HPG3_9ROSA|nr:hypothetical protein FNV43_RR05667 [Rhamnella rubrinervis]